MKIGKVLPEKFSKKWLVLFIAYALVLFFILAGIRLAGINPEMDFKWMAGLLVFSILVSLIVCIFGFFRLQFVFLLASLGIILGIILMIGSLMGDRNGWEDLIAVAYFLQFSVFGLGAGLVAELIAFFIRKSGKKTT